MIKIENLTGIGNHTRVLDALTGDDLGKRLRIAYGGSIKIDQSYVTMDCTIQLVRFDVTADQTTWLTKHPITGQDAALAEIRFRDGTVVRFDERGSVSWSPGRDEEK